MSWRRDLWKPLQGAPLPIESVRMHRLPLFGLSAWKLARRLRGQILYAVKPVPASFGVALAHRGLSGKPLLLDIDDDEVSFRPPLSLRAPARILSSLFDPSSRRTVRACLARIDRANEITVASLGLQRRFGGTLIPHAREMSRLKPPDADRAALRRRYRVPEGLNVVMFAGTPRPHKGIEDVAVAVSLMKHEAVLVLAGADAETAYVRSILSAFPRVLIIPPFPYAERESVLHIADVLVVPQREAVQSEMQVPAKLLDAMAARKPIVATAVSDIPSMLGHSPGDARGYLVAPGDVASMARALDAVFDDPAEALARASRAQEWCRQHASYDVVAPRLIALVTRALGTD
jgi:glycosyltransferase involved in cell wall biosynthesis